MYTKKYSQYIKINNPDKYNFTENLVWASPNGFDLTMDIYSPKNISVHCPVVVMFHGGGFLIRRKEILNNMAQYISSNHDYVVCNVNYRLLRDQNNSVMFQGDDEREFWQRVEERNREIAIKKAINFLTEQDVLLIAGKGHENYQLIGNKKKFFSDKITAKEYLRKK